MTSPWAGGTGGGVSAVATRARLGAAGVAGRGRRDRPAAAGRGRAGRHGEIVGLAAWHRGLLAAARRVEARGLPLLTAVDELDVMFDKRRCHALLRSRGVAVPEAFTASGYEEIRGQGLEQGVRQSRRTGRRRRGSSPSRSAGPGDRTGPAGRGAGPGAAGEGQRRAAGRGAAPGRGGRGAAPGQCLHVRGARRRPAVQLPAGAPLRRGRTSPPSSTGSPPDGLHVERWLPKAGQRGRAADLRVVVVAGRPPTPWSAPAGPR